jgi:HlyD family secretion protein
MVLAQIDDSLYAADAAMARAQLAQANAGVARVKADLLQMQAKLDQAKADWDRAQKLGASEALAQTAYDQYKANYEVAQANVEVGKANIVQAETAVDQAKATLQRAERNLAYCTIKSPVKGVIIARRVNIGQTVVASLNAPSLFLLAKDLKRMQVWVAVNEADIGSIHPGQPVKFTADAFPGRTFVGQVGKVRLNASMTQNVVTYTVEVVTDNSSGTLLPYLTANAQFEAHRVEKVLVVPNAALRWTPAAGQTAPDAQNGGGGGQTASAATGGAAAEAPAAHQARGRVWVPEGALARLIRVRVGLSDGTNTEVSGGGLNEGMEVITGDVQPGEARTPSGTRSPFTPQMPPRTRGGQANPPPPGPP